MRQLKLIYLLIKLYGIHGIKIFLKLYVFMSDNIRVPEYKTSINIRPHSSDISVFKQIFIFEEYNITLPFSPKIIIDSGANIGISSIYFAHQYPNAQIIAIEPEESNYMQLLKNVKNYKNIIPIKKALSNKEETLFIIDQKIGHWGYETISDEKHINKNLKNIISTSGTITITDIINKFNLNTIDVLKIDIEGYEKELFESNYEEWLPITKCIIIELHDRFKSGCSKSVFNAISQYNFHLYTKGENLIFINQEII